MHTRIHKYVYIIRLTGTSDGDRSRHSALRFDVATASRWTHDQASRPEPEEYEVAACGHSAVRHGDRLTVNARSSRLEPAGKCNTKGVNTPTSCPTWFKSDSVYLQVIPTVRTLSLDLLTWKGRTWGYARPMKYSQEPGREGRLHVLHVHTRTS